METDQYLAVVIYRPGSPNEAFGLQVLPVGQAPNSSTKLLSIADSMRQRGVSTAQFSGFFPGELEGPKDENGVEQLVYTWDHPKMWCSLPIDQTGLERLSTGLDLPIILYTQERGQEPVEYLRVNC